MVYLKKELAGSVKTGNSELMDNSRIEVKKAIPPEQEWPCKK